LSREEKSQVALGSDLIAMSRALKRRGDFEYNNGSVCVLSPKELVFPSLSGGGKSYLNKKRKSCFYTNSLKH
jgi:hypothetical protein